METKEEKEKPFILVRHFNKKNIETKILYGEFKYMKSLYFSNPMRIFFRQFKQKINNNYYILCPLYDLKGRHKLYKYDFQIGVSGTYNTEDGKNFGLVNYEQAMKRELGEELGIIPKKGFDSEKVFDADWDTNYQSWTVFSLNLKNIKVLNDDDEENFEKVDSSKDNKNKKVGCFVYGTEKDIENFLNKKTFYKYKSDDELCGIVAIKIKFI